MTQYSEKSYKMASDNTKYNDAGKAVILENDEWRDEKEWDEPPFPGNSCRPNVR